MCDGMGFTSGWYISLIMVRWTCGGRPGVSLQLQQGLSTGIAAVSHDWGMGSQVSLQLQQGLSVMIAAVSHDWGTGSQVGLQLQQGLSIVIAAVSP